MCDGVTDEGEEAVGGTSGTVQGVCEDGDDEGQSVTLEKLPLIPPLTLLGFF